MLFFADLLASSLERSQFPMLQNYEKKALTRLFLLCVGAPLALDRFYEGDVTGGILAILGLWALFWLIIPVLVWAFLVLKKIFVLLREFEGNGR
jgi:TM2 domain-containing membrane protein YozV